MEYHGEKKRHECCRHLEEKMFMNLRRGWVLLLVIMGAVSLAFFGFSISTMNQGLRSQVVHTKQMQASFQIGYSGYQRILAKIYLKPYEERYFKGAPVAENGISLFNAHYDTFVQDAPSQPNRADIFVRVKLEGTTRSYVWRVEHVPDLLDSKYFRTVFFTEVPGNQFPSTSNPGYSQSITNLIQERETNKPKADNLATQLAAIHTLPQITNLLNAPTPDLTNATDLPAPQSGVAPPAIAVANPAPVPPPNSLTVNPLPATRIRTADSLGKKIDADSRVTLKDITFEFNRSDLRPSSYPALEEVLRLLQSRPDLRIAVEGHTDSVGDEADNQVLSESRARSVFDWLVNRGVNSGRVQAIGKGESVPVADNATPQGQARNRRVELVKLN
jgi:outer membrane protein OmpA-like peptidoglycan-associated protein